MLIDDYPKFMHALCVWREARGESTAAKRGVAWVIRNRVANPRRFPNTIVRVILQPKHFSSFNLGDPNATLFPKELDVSWGAACAVVDEPGTDPTFGANHFHSHMKTFPKWANPKKITAVIGPFTFYKL